MRLESPMLGSVTTKDRIRRFARTSTDHDIEIHNQQWGDRIKKASLDLGIHIPDGGVKLPQGFRPPTLHLYQRRYNRTKSELFEAIRKGTVLTIDIVTSLSEDDFEEILTHVGKYYGLSPWGSKFGYGRFYLDQGDRIL